MHVTLWILQVVLAVVFASIAGSVTHFLPPEGLPESMRGNLQMAEMPAGVPYFIGTVEILAVSGADPAGIDRNPDPP